MILFIAAVGVAGLVAGGLSQAIGQMAVSLDDRGDQLAEAIENDIDIVNDPNNVPYDDAADELTLYVKNTGSRSLIEDDLTILVDGHHRDFSSSVVDGGNWTTGAVLEVTVDVDLASGDHTARAVYTPHISDRLEFRV